MKETTIAGDGLSMSLNANRPSNDAVSISGSGLVELFDSSGELKQSVPFTNLITRTGDQVYAELGSGAGTPNAPTGMRLGTGNTDPSKTGAGAAIVTYQSAVGSSQDFDATYPQSALNGSAREITYKRTYAAGEGTDDGIVEAVITNEATVTDVAGTEANTISRAIFTAVNKGADDTLTITWTHSFEAA